MLSTVQALKKKFVKLDVFPDEHLRFHVRVSHMGKSFVAGGFKSPDEAQRRGIAIMCAMFEMPEIAGAQ